jgi:hypothetical protein
MPGHVKAGKPGEADPDPSEYLVVTLEMKRAHMLKPYDPKKSYWCPDGKDGYMEGILDSDDDTKAVMICGHEVISRLHMKDKGWQLDSIMFPIPEKNLQVFRGWPGQSSKVREV